MKSVLRFMSYWLPPAIWMTLIFYLSSRQRITVSDEFTINFIIFKSLHMIEYATLYLLLFRAFYSAGLKEMVYPAICTLLYAVSDELHQTFVPTREGTVRDVIIDGVGIFLMYSYIKRNFHWLKKIII